MAAATDDTIYEVEVKGITSDVAETINRMMLAGWDHYQTMAGAVDGDRWMPVGCTLFFRRPLGGVRRRPAAEAQQVKAKGGGK